MKKVHTTDRERKSDQRLGCIAFPIVNGTIWLCWLLAGEGQTQTDVNYWALGAVWCVNGIIFILAVLFRPALGVGYIASIALILVTVTMLGCLFLASCVVGYAVGIPLGNIADSERGVNVGHALGYLVAFVLFFVGLYFLFQRVRAAYEDWWTPPPRDTQEDTRKKPD